MTPPSPQFQPRPGEVGSAAMPWQCHGPYGPSERSKPWRLPVEAGAAASSRKQQIHEEQKRRRMDLNAVRLPAKKTGNGSAALHCSAVDL